MFLSSDDPPKIQDPFTSFYTLEFLSRTLGSIDSIAKQGPSPQVTTPLASLPIREPPSSKYLHHFERLYDGFFKSSYCASSDPPHRQRQLKISGLNLTPIYFFICTQATHFLVNYQPTATANIQPLSAGRSRPFVISCKHTSYAVLALVGALAVFNVSVVNTLEVGWEWIVSSRVRVCVPLCSE